MSEDDRYIPTLCLYDPIMDEHSGWKNKGLEIITAIAMVRILDGLRIKGQFFFLGGGDTE